MVLSKPQPRLLWLLYGLSFLPYFFYTIGRLQELHPASPTSRRIQTFLSTHPLFFWQTGLALILCAALWSFFTSRLKEGLPRFLAVVLTHGIALSFLLLSVLRFLPKGSAAHRKVAAFVGAIPFFSRNPLVFLQAFLITLCLVMGWRHAVLTEKGSRVKSILWIVVAVFLALPVYQLVLYPNWSLSDDIRVELVLVKDKLDPTLFQSDSSLPLLRRLHPSLITEVLAFLSPVVSPDRAYQGVALVVMFLWPLSYLFFGRLLKGDWRWGVGPFLFAFNAMLPKLYYGLGGLLAAWSLLSFLAAQKKDQQGLFFLSGVFLPMALLAHPPAMEIASFVLGTSLVYLSFEGRKGWKWVLQRGLLLFAPSLLVGCFYIARIHSGSLSLATQSFLESTDCLWGRAYDLPKSLWGYLGEFSAYTFLESPFGLLLGGLSLYGLQRLLETKRPAFFVLPSLVAFLLLMAAGLFIKLGMIFLKPQKMVYDLRLVMPILASLGFVELYERLHRWVVVQQGFCIAVCLFLSLHWLSFQGPPREDLEMDRDLTLLCDSIKRQTPRQTKIAALPYESDTIRWIAERPVITSDELGGWGRYYREAGEEWAMTSRETIQALFSEDPHVVRNFMAKYNVKFFVDDERYREGDSYRYYRLIDRRVGRPWIRSGSREWEIRMRQGPYVVYEFLGNSS